MAYRNLPLNPLLRLIYFFLRFTAWVSTGIFYRRRLVLGREHLNFDGPAIVICNHPSTLMDVFNAGLPIHQEMFFLANYGLFRHPVSSWLFRRLFCIPVKRREDVEEGESRNNASAFDQSFRHLERGGVLFIAPEGTSWMNRFVRPFKSGTARIACGAEARSGWKLGVKIVPVGLNYSAPHLFRSDLVVQIGPPVAAADWAETWERDTGEAAAGFTAELERSVRSLTIDTRDEAGELFFMRLAIVVANSYPLPLREAFRRSRQLALRCLDDQDLWARTTAYFEGLQAKGLSDKGIAAWLHPRAAWKTLGEALFLLALMPLFLIGYALWFLPCWLPWLVNKQLKLYIGYSSTVKVLVGLITFPLALWGLYRLAENFWQNPWFAWLTLGLAIALAFFTERYRDVALRFFERWKVSRQATRRPGSLERLAVLRRRILAETTQGAYPVSNT